MIITNKYYIALGGGVNAYASTVGVLAALNEFDILKHLRYIGAVSGANWAMSGFTYTQKIIDDATYLGNERTN